MKSNKIVIQLILCVLLQGLVSCKKSDNKQVNVHIKIKNTGSRHIYDACVVADGQTSTGGIVAAGTAAWHGFFLTHIPEEFSVSYKNERGKVYLKKFFSQVTLPPEMKSDVTIVVKVDSDTEVITVDYEPR